MLQQCRPHHVNRLVGRPVECEFLHQRKSHDLFKWLVEISRYGTLSKHELLQRRRPRPSFNGLVKLLPKFNMLHQVRPNRTLYGLIEVFPERNLPQRGRPGHSFEGFVKCLHEYKLLEGSSPSNDCLKCLTNSRC